MLVSGSQTILGDGSTIDGRRPARGPDSASSSARFCGSPTWTIHNANHLRDSDDGLKVGGHQASSASLATLMTALYFAILRPAGPGRGEAARQPDLPRDPVSVRPADAREAGELPRLQGRAVLSVAHQGHRRRRFLDRLGRPRRRADAVRLARAGLCARHGPRRRTAPRAAWWRCVGDAEMDEGNIFEALLEGWKHGVRNTWWIVDYNRQSLDAVVREGLWARFEAMFRNFGWDVVILKYGALQERRLRGAGRRGAARLDRRLPQPALFGADLPGRRGVAQAPDDRPRRPGRRIAALIDAARDDAKLADADGQPRRPRPGVLLDGLRGGRHARPAGLLHRLHDQGLRAAARRPQGQPCRPDDAAQMERLPQGHERPRGP